MTQTPNLELTEVTEADTPAAEDLNDSFWAIDTILQLSVLSRIVTTPPTNAVQGDRYIVPAAATGEWSGRERHIAYMTPAGWRFRAPRQGWVAYSVDDDLEYRFVGTEWEEIPPGVSDLAAAVLSVLSAFTFITEDDETSALLGSRQLVAGSNITLDVTTPGQIEISSSGGGGGGAGSWETVATQTASSSSTLDFTGIDSSAYDQYMLVFDDLVLTGSSAAELQLRVGTGGTPTWDTGNNYDFYLAWEYGTSGIGTASRAFVSATDTIRLGTVSNISSPQNVPINGSCLVVGLPSGQNLKVAQGVADYDGASGLSQQMFSGVHNSTSDITALRIVPSGGTIASGRVHLMGRNF